MRMLTMIVMAGCLVMMTPLLRADDDEDDGPVVNTEVLPPDSGGQPLTQ